MVLVVRGIVCHVKQKHSFVFVFIWRLNGVSGNVWVAS